MKQILLFTTTLLLLSLTLLPTPAQARYRSYRYGYGDPFYILANTLSVIGAYRTMQVYEEKESYDSYLPTLNFKADYQKLTTDIQGIHVGSELGYGFMGLNLDYTGYFEKTPSTTYHLFSTHGLYRLSLFRPFQMNFAFGYKKYFGSLDHDAFDTGLPIYIFPTQKISVELEPYVSMFGNNAAYDFQGSLRYKYKHIGVRAGYRWIHVDGRNFQGPLVGVVAEW